MLLAIFLLYPAAASAATQPGESRVREGWVHERWGVADGLPVGAVNRIAQDARGYLWLATYGGLVRFDGQRFTVFETATEPRLPDNRFTTVHAAAGGGVVAATLGRKFVRYREGRFEIDGAWRPGPTAYALQSAADSPALWLGGSDGLVRLDEAGHRRIAPEGLAGPVLAAARAAGGGVWVGTRDAGVVRVAEGRVQQALTATDGLPSNRIESLARVGQALWVGTDRGLAVLSDGRIDVPAFARALGDRVIFAIAAPGNGSVWLATDRGVYGVETGSQSDTEGQVIHRPSPQERVAVRTRPAWRDRDGHLWVVTGKRLLRDGDVIWRDPGTISHVCPDREGNVWVASTRGLFRLRPTPFGAVTAADGLVPENIYPIYQHRDGVVWLGTLGGGLARIRNGRVDRLTPETHRVPATVWSIAGDGDGGLWIGGEGLCRLRDGRCSAGDIPPALRAGRVRAIHRDRRGRVWFGSSAGLYRYAEGRWDRLHPESDGAPAAIVRAFAEDRTGALWMGTDGDGLYRFSRGRFERLGRADGLAGDRVRAIHVGPSPDGSRVVWIGTEGRGISRIAFPGDHLGQARIANVSPRDGLPDGTVHRILADGRGRLWMSGNRGIWWLDGQQQRRIAAGLRHPLEPVAYTERHGLPTREANGGMHPAGMRAADGRLWFPTQAGAVVIDPADLPEIPVPPPVVIESITVAAADGSRRRAVDPLRGTIRLEAGERRLTVRYTAPSFVDPDRIRFRYRLAGFDRGWVEAGNARRAVYTNLVPGEYRFEIQAGNARGQWNASVTQRAVAIAPHFWQTTWFLVAAVAALVLVGVALGETRRRALVRRRKRLEATVAERTAELEREKRQTQAALDTVAEQAEALNSVERARSKFFANLSHELRTPVTVLLGGLREVLEGRFTTPDAQLAGHHRSLLANARELKRLIDQVLELQRAEAGRLELDAAPGDLAALVQEQVTAYRPLAERRRIALEAQFVPEEIGSCWRLFDADKLRRATGNLIANALKFTPGGGRVCVRLEEREGEVVIAVADTGPGIPVSEQARIFERFHQAGDAPARGGLGIGLALARELIGLHGARIELTSREGQGSEFACHLPLPAVAAQPGGPRDAPVPEARAHAPARPDPGRRADDADDADAGEQPALLIIEDHDDLRALLARSFDNAWRVLTAADGESGLERARAELPDLIVVDVMLPDTDGYAVTRRLKDDPATECIPVVMLTARAAVDDQVTGLDAGAEAYVVKPFEPETLQAQLRRLLAERRRLRARLQREAGPPASAPADDGDTLVGRARALIAAHLYDEDFGVERLAAALAMSRSALFRRLRAEAGTTPTALIREVRLDRARALLRDRHGSVSEVAYAVGYTSLASFSRAYASRFGHPPSAETSQVATSG